MMPAERLGLRAWLEEQIDSGNYRGVKWLDRSKGTFCVPWKHASRHGWVQNEDAALFKAWAVYTGRFKEGQDVPTPKTWKANFRCAVNALPDIKIIKGQGQCKGKNAYRVFEFSKKRKSRVTVCQRNVAIKLENLDQKPDVSCKQEEEETIERKYNTRQKSTRSASDISIKQDPEESYKGGCTYLHDNRGTNPQCLDHPEEPSCKRVKTEFSERKSSNDQNAQQHPFEDVNAYRVDKRSMHEPKLFSLYEILQKIPQFPNGKDFASTPSQYPPLFYNANIATPSLPDKLDDAVFDQLVTSVTNDIYIDSGNTFLYHAQTADSASESSDAEDIAEMFNDASSYRSCSVSSLSDAEWEQMFISRSKEEQMEAYQPMNKYMYPMVSSTRNQMYPPHSTSAVWSDAFFGAGPQPNDMISALKQVLTEQLA